MSSILLWKPSVIPLLRAVVHRVDSPALTTEWFPPRSPEAIEAVTKLLPLNSENFMVIWEEREVVADAQSSGG